MDLRKTAASDCHWSQSSAGPPVSEAQSSRTPTIQRAFPKESQKLSQSTALAKQMMANEMAKLIKVMLTAKEGERAVGIGGCKQQRPSECAASDAHGGTVLEQSTAFKTDCNFNISLHLSHSRKGQWKHIASIWRYPANVFSSEAKLGAREKGVLSWLGTGHRLIDN